MQVFADRFRRLAALPLIVLYLGCTAFYLYRQVVGDVGGSPFAYFWTWDMFPNYPAESSRRIVVGETKGGRFVRLLPGERDRFRWGRAGDGTRFDIDRRGGFLMRVIDIRVARYGESKSDDRLERVYLVEHYWPLRFNLPDDIYQSAYSEPNPERKYWRIIGEFPVSKDGSVEWETPP